MITDTTTSGIPRHPLYLNECDLILPFIPSMTPPANHPPSTCPFLSPSRPSQLFLDSSAIPAPFSSSASVNKPRPTPTHTSILPEPPQVVPHCRESVVMMNHPNTIHRRRRLRAQRSYVEDHHLHSPPIPRHPLQSQHLNEHDLISTLIMPPMPPPLPNHPPLTLPNPSLPSQPKSRRTSPSRS